MKGSRHSSWIVAGACALVALIAAMLMSAAVASIWLDDIATEFVIGTAIGVFVGTVTFELAKRSIIGAGATEDPLALKTRGRSVDASTHHNVIASSIISTGSGTAIGVNHIEDPKSRSRRDAAG